MRPLRTLALAGGTASTVALTTSLVLFEPEVAVPEPVATSAPAERFNRARTPLEPRLRLRSVDGGATMAPPLDRLPLDLGEIATEASVARRFEGQIVEPPARSPHQVPMVVAAFDVSLQDNQVVDSVEVDLELAPATLRVRDENGEHDLTIPAELIAWDELDVVLIDPAGHATSLAAGLQYRDDAGEELRPFPVSALEDGARATRSGVQLVAPVVSELGLPELDSEGQLMLQRRPCGDADWWLSRDGSHAFPRCSRQDTQAFLAEVGPAVGVAEQSLQRRVRAEVESTRSFGTWKVVVRDARPLLHDALPITAAQLQGYTAKPEVTRVTLERATLRVHGAIDPYTPRRVYTQRFWNEARREGPRERAFVGASDVFASGMHLQSLRVGVEAHPLGEPLRGPSRVQLITPDGTPIEVGMLPEGNTALTSDLQVPARLGNRPVDGQWRLVVENQGRDVSPALDLAWWMDVRGPSTLHYDVAEVDVTLSGDEESFEELEFWVEGPDTPARALWVDLGADNFVAFEHEVEVVAPSGLRIPACGARGDSEDERCLRIGVQGQSAKVELPPGVPAAGIWKVRFRAERHENALSSGLGIEVQVVSGPDCTAPPPALGGGGTGGSASVVLGDQLRARRVRISAVRLGVSQSLETARQLGHRAVDRRESGPRWVDVHTPEGLHRVGFESAQLARDFWHSFGLAQQALLDFEGGKRGAFEALSAYVAAADRAFQHGPVVAMMDAVRIVRGDARRPLVFERSYLGSMQRALGDDVHLRRQHGLAGLIGAFRPSRLFPSSQPFPDDVRGFMKQRMAWRGHGLDDPDTSLTDVFRFATDVVLTGRAVGDWTLKATAEVHDVPTNVELFQQARPDPSQFPRPVDEADAPPFQEPETNPDLEGAMLDSIVEARDAEVREAQYNDFIEGMVTRIVAVSRSQAETGGASPTTGGGADGGAPAGPTDAGAPEPAQSGDASVGGDTSMCAPHDLDCYPPPSDESRALIEHLRQVSARAPDELQQAWGRLAPYVYCPHDASGCTPMATGLVVDGIVRPDVAPLDPYILCAADSSSPLCGGGPSTGMGGAVLCAKFGGGYTDPVPWDPTVPEAPPSDRSPVPGTGDPGCGWDRRCLP